MTPLRRAVVWALLIVAAWAFWLAPLAVYLIVA